MGIGPKIGRRDFLQISAMAAAYSLKGQGEVTPPDSASGVAHKKMAAIAATYSIRSVADNLITRLLQGYWIGDDYHHPKCNVVSLYIDRMEAIDVGSRISAAYGITLARSISEALTLGSGSLAVDGILLVGGSEHKQADNAPAGRDLRFKFFEQIVDVFRKAGRSVPVFCAGYLSLNWDQAKRMHQWSRELNFPLMAGVFGAGHISASRFGLSAATRFRRCSAWRPRPS